MNLDTIDFVTNTSHRSYSELYNPNIPSACYVIDHRLLDRNLAILTTIKQRTDASLLLALKAFSSFSSFPFIAESLDGASASSLHEARLADSYFSSAHLYSPAYSSQELQDSIPYCSHIIFNSLDQFHRFKRMVPKNKSIGLRINPGYSEVKKPIYNPCSPFSRFGIPFDHLNVSDLEGVSGLHIHNHCEQGADALSRSLDHCSRSFPELLDRVSWVNLGGGQLFTADGYDSDHCIHVVNAFKSRHTVHVIFEPGESVVLNTGFLVATVLDIIHNGMPIAILDTSATAHMPDVIEMPYRPEIIGAADPSNKAHTYRLAGKTCLSGDVIGDYSFDTPLEIGSRIIFKDMAHYTMVKNTTFNGLQLPHIGLIDLDGSFKLIKSFGYEDFKGRLS